MKIIQFIILSLFFVFIKADGDAYEVTYYGGSSDNNTHLNPFCLDDEEPNTDYYAAVSRYDYDKKLCNSYAIVMGVDLDRNNRDYYGKMVKVRIIDSCRECEDSHIDVSPKAFETIGVKSQGRFRVIWMAGSKSGSITRNVIYPSSDTEEFAKEVYGLSKSSFVEKFKAQALKLMKSDSRSARFDKNYAATTRKTTTTTRRTTTIAVVPTVAPSVSTQNTPNTPVTPNTPNVPVVETPPMVSTNNTVGGIIINTGKTNNTDSTDVDGKVEPVSVDDIKDNDDKKDEEENDDTKNHSDDDENKEGTYSVGILSAALTISGAASIGLIYMKKTSPSKYEELKSKFPEAFENVKRGVSRSATSIRRGLTRTYTGINRAVSRGKSLRKNSDAKISRHGDHSEESNDNYRQMPIYGEDGIPRYTLYDPQDGLAEESSINIKI